jgi:hypothetical protein
VIQQVNLYNERFEKRHELLSLRGAAAAWSGALLLVVATAIFAALRVSALENELAKESAARAAAQAELSSLAKRLASRLHDPALAEQVTRLESEVNGRRNIMETLRGGGVLGNTEGFSSYLRAFARQSFDGLWLTAFSLAGAGQDVVLQGRSLRPELVPSYVQRLNREQVMKGRVFSELQMQRPAPRGEAAVAANLPPFIEFRLATLPAPAEEKRP